MSVSNELSDLKPLVLVADGDANVRTLIGRYLSEGGYEVSYACTGYEALDSARKNPPAALLADLLLPQLDGLTLCRLLMRDPVPGVKQVKVVVLSVLAAEDRSKQAGALGFIKKPLEKTRVLQMLSELMTSKTGSA